MPLKTEYVLMLTRIATIDSAGSQILHYRINLCLLDKDWLNEKPPFSASVAASAKTITKSQYLVMLWSNKGSWEFLPSVWIPSVLVLSRFLPAAETSTQRCVALYSKHKETQNKAAHSLQNQRSTNAVEWTQERTSPTAGSRAVQQSTANCNWHTCRKKVHRNCWLNENI